MCLTMSAISTLKVFIDTNDRHSGLRDREKKYFIQWYSVIISTGGNSVKGAGVGNR